MGLIITEQEQNVVNLNDNNEQKMFLKDVSREIKGNISNYYYFIAGSEKISSKIDQLVKTITSTF